MTTILNWFYRPYRFIPLFPSLAATAPPPAVHRRSEPEKFDYFMFTATYCSISVPPVYCLPDFPAVAESLEFSRTPDDAELDLFELDAGCFSGRQS